MSAVSGSGCAEGKLMSVEQGRLWLAKIVGPLNFCLLTLPAKWNLLSLQRSEPAQQSGSHILLSAGLIWCCESVHSKRSGPNLFEKLLAIKKSSLRDV